MWTNRILHVHIRVISCDKIELHFNHDGCSYHIVLYLHNSLCDLPCDKSCDFIFIYANWTANLQFEKDTERTKKWLYHWTYSNIATFYLELLTRFELVTSSLPRKCSTNWAITAKMELLTRFELVTSSLPRKCSTNWAITAIMLHLSVWKRITLITKCFLLEYFVFCSLVNQRILL